MSGKKKRRSCLTWTQFVSNVCGGRLQQSSLGKFMSEFLLTQGMESFFFGGNTTGTGDIAMKYLLNVSMYSLRT